LEPNLVGIFIEGFSTFVWIVNQLQKQENPQGARKWMFFCFFFFVNGPFIFQPILMEGCSDDETPHLVVKALKKETQVLFLNLYFSKSTT
jgi:hypothetical protein